MASFKFYNFDLSFVSTNEKYYWPILEVDFVNANYIQTIQKNILI